MWAVLVPSAAAIAAGGSQLVGLYKSPVWLSVVLISAGALGAAAAPLLQAKAAKSSQDAEDRKRAEERAASERSRRQRAIRDLVAIHGAPADTLPRVQDINPYGVFGVSRSIRAAQDSAEPYAHREVDAAIDEELRRSSFIIIVGDSKSGKSRTGYEAMLRNYPGSQILVPSARPRGLRDLFELAPPAWTVTQDPVLLWLDDIERYLSGSNGLDATFLEQIESLETRIVMIGTLTSKRRDSFMQAQGEVGRATRMVLEKAAQIWMEPRLTDAEYSAAQELYPDLAVERAFAEQLVAASTLKRKYFDGRQAAPVGWAIVQTACDWRRIGFTRPIKEGELKKLYAIYLSARPDIDPSDRLFTDGLRWAREPVAAESALLRRVGTNSQPLFAIFDYIVALADGQGDSAYRPIPDEYWAGGIQLAQPLEIVDIGTTALSRSSYEMARQAFDRAIDSGDTAAAALAANELGLMLEMNEHDEVIAEKLYRQAMASGDFGEGNAWAANNLGNLLARQGKIDEAMEMYQAAIIPENTQHSIPANSLGQHLLEKGDVAGAKENFKIAMRSGQTFGSVTLAALNLGSVLESEGDKQGAADAWQFAMEHPYHPPAAGEAGLLLGDLCSGEGLTDAAKEVYQVVLDSGWYEPCAALGAQRLAGIYAAEGDTGQARAMYRRAAVEQNPELALSALKLGQLLLRDGARAEAMHYFGLAADAGEPKPEARAAALELGCLLREDHDLDGAEARLRFAAAGEQRDETAARAAAQLAALRQSRDAGSTPAT
jgi:tetratricopeptide (TPR) repeat protein